MKIRNMRSIQNQTHYFLLFIVLAAWAMSYLNTENEFFVPQFASVSLNLFAIAVPIAMFGYFFDRGRDPILGMAIGMTIGGLAQFLVQIPRLLHKGFVYYPVLNFRDAAFRKSMKLFVPVAIGLSASRINVWVSTMLISGIPGGISWLNYAYRIFFLPLGMLGVFIDSLSYGNWNGGFPLRQLIWLYQTSTAPLP